VPYLFNKYYPVRNLFFFFGEGLLAFLAINGAYYFLQGPEVYSSEVILYVLRALVVTFITQLVFYFSDLYDLSRKISHGEAITRLIQALGIVCVFLGIVYFLVPLFMISGLVFWVGYLVLILSVLCWRFLYNNILDHKMFSQPVLVVGSGKLAARIISEITSKRDIGYRVVGVMQEAGRSDIIPPDLILTESVEVMPKLCQQLKVERIIVALEDRRGKTPIKELLKCKLQGIAIEQGVSFYEALTGRILVEEVNPGWLIYSDGFARRRFTAFAKRVVDFLLAVLGLLISLPVSLVSALIIKLESPGPVLYLQERVGLKGEIFKVIKFRSMVSDAEKDGAVWASKNDSRVTRFGGFIRKVRIDELPQMWNVIRGEMSFVGPRPERPVFVDQLKKKIPYYSLRHSVKPGISGWAQICYPYGASEEDALRKLEYDLYYIKNMTFKMEIWVIFQTIKTVLCREGSR